MPQMNKGGKFIFGKSLVRNDLSVQLPPQAILEYNLEQGRFVKYKGRLYCWVSISTDGIIQLTDMMMKALNISIGTELLSIRSSDIAFCMGAKGLLLERSENYEGKLDVY